MALRGLSGSEVGGRRAEVWVREVGCGCRRSRTRNARRAATETKVAVRK